MSPGAIGTVAALGIATLAIAYLLWGAGLEALSLSTVVSVTLVEPAVATALAVVVLREPVTARLIVGVVAIAIGVSTGAHSATRQTAHRELSRSVRWFRRSSSASW